MGDLDRLAILLGVRLSFGTFKGFYLIISVFVKLMFLGDFDFFFISAILMEGMEEIMKLLEFFVY